MVGLCFVHSDSETGAFSPACSLVSAAAGVADAADATFGATSAADNRHACAGRLSVALQMGNAK